MDGVVGEFSIESLLRGKRSSSIGLDRVELRTAIDHDRNQSARKRSIFHTRATGSPTTLP